MPGAAPNPVRALPKTGRRFVSRAARKLRFATKSRKRASGRRSTPKREVKIVLPRARRRGIRRPPKSPDRVSRTFFDTERCELRNRRGYRSPHIRAPAGGIAPARKTNELSAAETLSNHPTRDQRTRIYSPSAAPRTPEHTGADKKEIPPVRFYLSNQWIRSSGSNAGRAAGSKSE